MFDHAFITAVATAVLAIVVPVVRAYVLTKLTPQRIGHVHDIARIAVRASEQLGLDNPQGTSGAQKLNYASDVVVAGAKRLGVKLTQDEVLAFVHAALREMKQVDAMTAPAHA